MIRREHASTLAHRRAQRTQWPGGPCGKFVATVQTRQGRLLICQHLHGSVRQIHVMSTQYSPPTKGSQPPAHAASPTSARPHCTHPEMKRR